MIDFISKHRIRRQNSIERIPRPVETSSHLRPASNAQIQLEEINLVQQIFLKTKPSAPRIVVFGGVDHSSGCSWICARAAETLATLVTQKVCVVDANLRSPCLNRYFGIANEKGLADFEGGGNELMRHTVHLPDHNLWVLPSGKVQPNPVGLFNSPKLQKSLLRLGFDYLLIDTPPLAHFPDAYMLRSIADGIVLVVQANSTRRDVAQKVKDSLSSAQMPVLAAVLNKSG